MRPKRETWAIVLAAGEGTRLRALTTFDGRTTPKQFCSLRGGRSLFTDALLRAARVAPWQNVVAVVAEDQRSHWQADVAQLRSANVVVQPENRGTAAGILLPLLHVLRRAPNANVVVLPSDHWVEREQVLAASLRAAVRAVESEPGIVLLGISPDAPETSYGWIVPEGRAGRVHPVRAFVEKPAAARAAALQRAGGVWNSFLFAGRARRLLELLRERLPALSEPFERAAQHGALDRPAQLSELYERLPAADFSRDFLESCTAELRVLVVPPCGWTDLGTPERVAACLAALAGPRPRLSAAFEQVGARPDLSRAVDVLLRQPGGVRRVLTA